MPGTDVVIDFDHGIGAPGKAMFASANLLVGAIFW